ncbi:MAG: TRAP transporter small permease [Chloroflexi bacterium]|nr:TRAP transporter small permease [Chloroflexota bacterium]MBM3182815.1 TRAP transporter small permease [Chloroflexota bacterium]MBM4451905.1 TRAP transporter small permease [Chloroflexota bacterium]MBM4453563.1 TRAP transporter small permease [Chloroflexota bacterium]
MSSKLDTFKRVVDSLSNWLNWIAGVALVLMLALIAIDIIGAKFFRWPVPGGIDVVGLLGVVAIGFAIARTQAIRGHIEVEFFEERIPQRVRNVVDVVIYSLGILLFGLLAWKTLEYGYTLHSKGEVSMTQGIPLSPFVYGMAFCYLAVFLVLLVQCIEVAYRIKK